MLHITDAQHQLITIVMIVTVLVIEFGGILLTVRAKSLFGFLATLGAFALTFGSVLLFNTRDERANYLVPYKTVDGIATWHADTHKVLFWSHIDMTFIQVFIVFGVLCIIPATVLYVIKARRNDKRDKELAELRKQVAELKPKGPRKQASAETGTPANAGASETAKVKHPVQTQASSLV